MQTRRFKNGLINFTVFSVSILFSTTSCISAAQLVVTAANAETSYQNQNYNTAFTVYLTIAKNNLDPNNDLAKNNLGILCALGQGTQQNYTKAMTWFLQAAAQGDSDAMKNIGLLYEAGQGVTQNYHQAMIWFQKAAEFNNPEAEYHIGYLYANGEGVAQDFQQAFDWFNKATTQNEEVDAENALGDLYFYGNGVTQNFTQAFQKYMIAANLKDSEAQFNLGYAYENGLGTPDNMETPQCLLQALAWYQIAAHQHQSNASEAIKRIAIVYKKLLDQNSNTPVNIIHNQYLIPTIEYELGDIYKLGLDGNAPDYKYALCWYELSACNPDSIGIGDLRLADAYEHGIGVPQAADVAYSWYNKALQTLKQFADDSQNLEASEAQYQLGKLYETGLTVIAPTVKSYTAPITITVPIGPIFKVIFATGVPQSTPVTTATTPGTVVLVRQDYALAAYWYQQAAKANDIDAQQALANLYFKQVGVSGNNVQESITAAVHWAPTTGALGTFFSIQRQPEQSENATSGPATGPTTQ